MTSFNMNRAFQSKNKRVSIKSCFLFVVVSHRWPAELLSAAVVQQFFLSCIRLSQRHNQHCSGLSSGQQQLCFGARCSELCQFSLLIVCLWVSVCMGEEEVRSRQLGWFCFYVICGKVWPFPCLNICPSANGMRLVALHQDLEERIRMRNKMPVKLTDFKMVK